MMFLQLVLEGFAVVALAAILSAVMALAVATIADPVSPLGDKGKEIASSFFTPASEKKAQGKIFLRGDRQEYSELDLQGLLDYMRESPSSEDDR